MQDPPSPEQKGILEYQKQNIQPASKITKDENLSESISIYPEWCQIKNAILLSISNSCPNYGKNHSQTATIDTNLTAIEEFVSEVLTKNKPMKALNEQLARTEEEMKIAFGS